MVILCTVEQLLLVPTLANTALAPVPWLNQLLGAADRAVKRYLKRDIELMAYSEPYSGFDRRDLILRQYPLWVGQTAVAAGSPSDGAALPQSTIHVNSTKGFHPGLMGDVNADPPALAIRTGVTTWTNVTYTGTQQTPTIAFTGCSGGTGTLSSQYGRGVSSPVAFFDPMGYYGQAPDDTGFFQVGPQTTQLVLGVSFAAVVDSPGNKSERGLLRRIGADGPAPGFFGFFPGGGYHGGKLGGHALAQWWRGDGNVYVKYTAGYAPQGSGYRPWVPEDITWATAMLAAYMVRNLPSGVPLSSENLGSYSYSILDKQSAEIPELGSIARTLAPYRESSWGV